MRFLIRTTPVHWLWLSAVLFGALLWLDAALVRTQPPDKKNTVPNQEALVQALEKLKAENRDAFDKAGTDPKIGLDLANLLIKDATKKLPAETFVRLEQAWKLASQAGDYHIALWAIEELEEWFEVDGLPFKAEALKESAQAAKSPEASTDLVDHVLKLAGDAVNQDRFDLAADFGQSAETAARKSKDLPLVLSVLRERQWVADTTKQFLALKPFQDRLDVNLADAEANLQVGKYYAFLRGDWDRGLFLLAQSSDPDLRLLAQRDLIKPEDSKAQIEIGDAWWDLADKYQDQVKIHLRQRAVYWYQHAIYAADGLVLGKLEERIESVPVSNKFGVPWDYSGPPQQIKVVGNHFGNVFGVAFSPDGRLVASGASDNRAIIWDIKTGNKLKQLVGHTSSVWGVAFDPKGKHIFTSSWDGTVRMWDVKTGDMKKRFPPVGQFGSMFGLDVSPNGRLLLTGSTDGSVRVWDIKTGNEVQKLVGHKGQVYGVTFFADGKKALSGGSFDRQVIVWDLDKGKDILKINNPGNSGRYVSVSPDGTKAVASGESVVRMWDLRNGNEIRQFKGHTSQVYTVAFSPNGKRLITGGLDSTIRYWDVATGNLLHTFKGHNSTVYALAFSAGGGRVVSGGVDNTVRLWGLPR